ncbi:LOW QUALITY PROTEIN: mesoderm induction early response protein 2 [Micropterus salmoides]|uniref:LOW QUALITY PROTEIN: mesoderm induction early response protein 2 n=1 Tax=Micropterus salmoides TaxID=27706 RepID=UPI0018EC75AB|nr:LOW QUALITY PROTEIN: mesoderm induction early response protein 2 [Micropterus salmoides]
MRYCDEGPQQEKQMSQQALEELEENFRPIKMATQSHTASELPLEELLALYGYAVSDPEKETCHMAARLPDMTLDKDQITEDLFPGEEEEESSADDLTPSVTSNTSDLLRRLQGGDKDPLVCSSDEESDDASVPSNEEHKEIMVGSMYQAKIPPLGPYTNQERAYSSEDQLLWRPGVLPLQEVEEFLLYAQKPRGQEGTACMQTQGDTVQDNEQALYELVKCNFNAEEALRRLRFNVKVFSEELCAWSEEECRNFEHGYRVYGKNFHLIQANKVRTRSVGECVEYYYMWKKSDRHEYFTQQATRLSRRKYNLQSGSMEDGDQDGEVGELEGSNNSSGLSHSSMGTGQLESPLPPQSSLDLDKQGGELMMGLSDLGGNGCPQQLFGFPFSLSPVDDLRDPGSGNCQSCPSAPVQLQSQPSSQSCQWADGSPPFCHDDHHLPGSCFYQLHMCGGPFVSESPDCGTAGGGTGSPHGLQVEFSLSPSASPPSSAVLPSHFQAFGSLLHPLPSSIPALSHSEGTWENQNLVVVSMVCPVSRSLICFGISTGLEEIRTKSAFT